MIAALALLAALGRPAAAQDVRWSINPSTAQAQLGVPFAISGTVASDFSKDLAFELSVSTDAAYAVADAHFGKSVVQGSERLQPFSARILPLAVGKISVFLTCAPPAGTPQFQSPLIPITVAEPSLPKDAEPRDIKAPRSARPPLWPWLLLAALLAAGYALYRKLSKKTGSGAASSPAADSRPPEVIAESELGALQKSGLWELGRHKDFYSALTDILKRYLERRFGFAAPQMTTAEISRALRREDPSRGLSAKAKGVLDRADLIKFAKISPDPEWGPSDIVAAIQIVRDTTPQPAPDAPHEPARTKA
ncbi:MAG: hypothetical protein KGL04_10110 [Elusimicrobia bacterium]|nr:hypothetical protein [Elusimicrobiota bacterium]